MDDIAGDGFDAEVADAVEVGFDGLLVFASVLFEALGGDGSGVDEGVVEDGLTGRGAGVLEDLFDVLGGGEADGLVGLGHEVADEDAGGFGFGEGLGDAVDEEVGDEGGVEGAGAEGDQIGFRDGMESLGQGFAVAGLSMSSTMRFLLAVMLVSPWTREPSSMRAVRDVGVGGGEDASAGGEDLGGHLDGLGEVSGDVGEGGDEEIAEAVAFELALAEAELEELGEEVLVFGEGDHAVADVAGGEHLEVFAETAGGAAVVGDGDYGGEVADDAGQGGAGGGGVPRVMGASMRMPRRRSGVAT